MQKQILDTEMGNKANLDLYSGAGCEETMSEKKARITIVVTVC